MLSCGQDEDNSTSIIGFPGEEERKEGKYHILSNYHDLSTVQGTFSYVISVSMVSESQIVEAQWTEMMGVQCLEVSQVSSPYLGVLRS